MEQKMSDSVAEKKDKGIDAVLHTKQQRKRSKAHEEQLKQEGKNAKQYLCKGELSSLHLIVDTCLYGILMSGGRLCEDAFMKFTELDETGKTIYVVNTFSNEFDDLYHQIPQNARELWDQKKSSLQLDEDSVNLHKEKGLPNVKRLRIENSVTGVTGGTVTTANSAGDIKGGMGNKTNGTSMNIHTKQNIQIILPAPGEECVKEFTVNQESSSPNGLKVTIQNAKKEKEILDKLESKKDTLRSGPVHEVETGTGSVIINLTVDRSHIMTDAWIEEILEKIFNDILKDCNTEERALDVTVERYISIGVDDFLRLYSTYHNHEQCVAKIEAMKSQIEALAMQGESSLNINSEPFDDETSNQEPLVEDEIDDKSKQKPLEEDEIADTSKQEPFEEDEIDDKSKQEPMEEKDIDVKSLGEKPFPVNSEFCRGTEIRLSGIPHPRCFPTETLYNTRKDNPSATRQENEDVTMRTSYPGWISYMGISKTAEALHTDTISHIKEWNKDMVRTAALDKVLDKLKSGATWVTIKGNPGEGKTTVGYMALEELHRSDRQVFEVRSPDDFTKIIETCSRPVIMLDDVFGNPEFAKAKWQVWRSVLSKFLDDETNPPSMMRCKSPKTDASVILLGRDCVLNSAPVSRITLSKILRSDEHMVHMGHSLKRSVEEKRAILETISKSSGIVLDKTTVDNLLKVEVPLGFPTLCQLVTTIIKENKTLS